MPKAKKPEYIWVKAVKGLNEPREGEHRVLLFERDDAHPNGEAFIAGPLPVQVGETVAVTRLLKDEAIEETEAGDVIPDASAQLANQLRALEVRNTEHETALSEKDKQIEDLKKQLEAAKKTT